MISVDRNISHSSFITDYDNSGAMMYIVVVLFWYSMGVIFMIGMQMLAQSEELEDLARRRTRFLIGNLRDRTNTREILEELVDKRKRDRLWDIYLGTNLERKDWLTQAETIRIRHIEKQLETINRNHRLNEETLFPTSMAIRPSFHPSHSFPNAPSTGSSRFRTSSFDEQTFGHHKDLSNRSSIRRLIVRHRSKRSSHSEPPRIRVQSIVDQPLLLTTI